jgi:hypothetical protein
MGMAALGKDAEHGMDIRAGYFAGVDPAAQWQGIFSVGTKIPDARKTPPCQHLAHVLLQRRSGSEPASFQTFG